MKYINKATLILSVWIALAATINAQGKFQSVIDGRVVNSTGQPVANAKVYFDVPSKLYEQYCWAKENDVTADGDGRFTFHEYCGVERRSVTLTAVPPVSLRDVVTPIYPQFWTTLIKSDSRFAGTQVPVYGNRNTDVGDIRVSVPFKRFRLFVLDRLGRPYYRTNKSWNRFTLIVRDSSGRGVGSQTLSLDDIERKVDLALGCVAVSLPEGTWTLELLPSLEYYTRDDITKRLLGKVKLEVKADSPQSDIKLIVR